MTGQYIQRVPNRRRRGCVFTALIVVVMIAVLVVVLLPYLPGIALRIAGFRELGDTVAIVDESDGLFGTPSSSFEIADLQAFIPTATEFSPPTPTASSTPAATDSSSSTSSQPPTPAPTTTPSPVPSATPTELADVGEVLSVDIPNVGIIPLEGARQMLVNGIESTVVTMGEEQLNALCRARIALCGDTPTPPVYGATVDLKSGGAMIYGIINFPQFGIYQSVGVAVRVDGANADVLAIDYNGRLYAVPEGGIGDAIANIEQRARDALTQVVGAVGGESVRFVGASLTDDEVTLVFR